MSSEQRPADTAGARSPRPLVPPFNMESALAKVRAAEDAWNSRDPDRVSLAYSPDSQWRNRDQFIQGRDQIRTFLQDKWSRELDYRLAKSLWEFDDAGLMRRREASINDMLISESDRRFRWEAPGPRPIDDPGIPEVK